MNIPGTFQIRYGPVTDLYYFFMAPDTLDEPLTYVVHPSPRSIVETIFASSASADAICRHTHFVPRLQFLMDTGLSTNKAYEIYIACISNHTTQAHTT